MKNLFERTSSQWVRYSEYEWKAAEDGTLYLTPTKAAQPGIYDPLAEYRHRFFHTDESNKAKNNFPNS